MGKAAENERIKLRATFLNNIAVGLAITGILVPYLTFIQGASSLYFRVIFDDFLAGNITQLRPAALKLFAMFLAAHGLCAMGRAPK
jgi:hypothetical protein